MKYWKVYFYEGKHVATAYISAPVTWLVQRIERSIREKAELTGPVLAESVDSLPEGVMLFHELTDKK